MDSTCNINGCANGPDGIDDKCSFHSESDLEAISGDTVKGQQDQIDRGEYHVVLGEEDRISIERKWKFPPITSRDFYVFDGRLFTFRFYDMTDNEIRKLYSRKSGKEISIPDWSTATLELENEHWRR
jgi:hypothetical protein